MIYFNIIKNTLTKTNIVLNKTYYAGGLFVLAPEVGVLG